MPVEVAYSVTQTPKSVRVAVGVHPADTHHAVPLVSVSLYHGMG